MDSEKFHQAKLTTVTIRGFLFLSLLIFVITRIGAVVLAASLDVRSSVDLIFDDAYYYLTVAYNFAHLGNSTFDGQTATNGYQPLWAWLLAGFETIFRFDKKSLFVFSIGLTGLLVTLPLFAGFKRRQEPFWLALLAGMMATYVCYPHVWILGLETVLLAPLFFLAVDSIRRRGVIDGRDFMTWLFCVVILVRLDTVSVLLSYTGLLFYLVWQKEDFKQACSVSIRFLLPSACTLLIYGIANKIAFGIAVPVSGAAKMVGAQPFSNWGIIFHYLVSAQLVFIVLLVLLTVEVLWGRFRNASFYYSGILIFFSASLIHYFYYASFSGWIPWPWYFYSFALILILLVARLTVLLLDAAPAALNLMQASGKIIAAAVVILIVPALTIANTSMAALSFLHGGPQPADMEAASFNKRNIDSLNGVLNTQQHLTVAMGDRAGGLGYWAGDNVSVFQLEGLVANAAYLDARRTDHAKQWLMENIKPDLLVVDREYIPSIDVAGTRTYVVIEPVQGRVVFDHLLTFCFPEDAVVDRVVVEPRNPSIVQPNVRRFIFDMRKSVACNADLEKKKNELIFSVDGPRQKALETEYGKNQLNKNLELFDRRLALYRRERWHRSL